MTTKTAGRMGWWVVAALLATLPVNGFAQAPMVVDQGQASAPAISPGAAEVVKLAESGSSDEVMLAYIQNARTPYQLTADAVIYLKDLGLSSAVVTAMLAQDSALGNQPPPYTYDQQLYPATKPASAAQLAAAPAAAEPPMTEQLAPEAAPAPVYVNDAPAQAGYFYSDLAPYGAWLQVDGLGWCWQPSAVVVNHGWQPYCDGGHWIYTDAGWFWQSDYSWGWAPFHYGRWLLHERCGWVWVPDTVWGPAWVTWRATADTCGWAPLPPRAEFDVRLGFRFNGLSVGANFDFGLGADRFTFVALRDFNERDVLHHRLGPEQCRAVFPRTTVLHNYSVANNNVIINHGLPVERVAAVTQVQIRQTAVRDLSSGDARMVRAGAVNRNEPVAYRTQLRPPQKSLAMAAQHVDEQHPVVEHRAVAALTVAKPAPPAGAGRFDPGSAARPVQPDRRNPAGRGEGQRGAASSPDRIAPGNRQPAAPALPPPGQPGTPDRGARAYDVPGANRPGNDPGSRGGPPPGR